MEENRMGILKTIIERRSAFAFKKDEVELAALKEIFAYGSYAPTHYMTESWRVKLYQRTGKKDFVASIIKSYQRSGMLGSDDSEKTLRSIQAISQFLLDIPHHALIYYHKEQSLLRNEEEYSSVAAFIQNTQLAAWAYGVGVLWTITPYMYDKIFIEEIGLDDKKHKIAAVLQIGYPRKVSQMKKRSPVERFLEVIE